MYMYPFDMVVVNLELSVSSLEKFTAHRQEIIQQTKANIQQAQQKQKEAYDRKHAHPDAFQVGAYVLKKDFLRKKRANGKLDAQYLGLYIITKKLGKGLYALKLAANHTRTIDTVNGAHLKPYFFPHSPTPEDKEERASSSPNPSANASSVSQTTTNLSMDGSVPPSNTTATDLSMEESIHVPPIPSMMHYRESHICNLTQTLIPAPEEVCLVML